VRVVRATPPSVIRSKDFVATASVTNDLKSARLTELTELTDNRPSSGMIRSDVGLYYAFVGKYCCRDATRLGHDKLLVAREQW